MSITIGLISGDRPTETERPEHVGVRSVLSSWICSITDTRTTHTRNEGWRLFFFAIKHCHDLSLSLGIFYIGYINLTKISVHSELVKCSAQKCLDSYPSNLGMDFLRAMVNHSRLKKCWLAVLVCHFCLQIIFEGAWQQQHEHFHDQTAMAYLKAKVWRRMNRSTQTKPRRPKNK